jgi:hypothetical protein
LINESGVGSSGINGSDVPTSIVINRGTYFKLTPTTPSLQHTFDGISWFNLDKFAEKCSMGCRDIPESSMIRKRERKKVQEHKIKKIPRCNSPIFCTTSCTYSIL